MNMKLLVIAVCFSILESVSASSVGSCRNRREFTNEPILLSDQLTFSREFAVKTTGDAKLTVTNALSNNQSRRSVTLLVYGNGDVFVDEFYWYSYGNETYRSDQSLTERVEDCSGFKLFWVKVNVNCSQSSGLFPGILQFKKLPQSCYVETVFGSSAGELQRTTWRKLHYNKLTWTLSYTEDSRVLLPLAHRTCVSCSKDSSFCNKLTSKRDHTESIPSSGTFVSVGVELINRVDFTFSGLWKETEYEKHIEMSLFPDLTAKYSRERSYTASLLRSSSQTVHLPRNLLTCREFVFLWLDVRNKVNTTRVRFGVYTTGDFRVTLYQHDMFKFPVQSWQLAPSSQHRIWFNGTPSMCRKCMDEGHSATSTSSPENIPCKSGQCPDDNVKNESIPESFPVSSSPAVQPFVWSSIIFVLILVILVVIVSCIVKKWKRKMSTSRTSFFKNHEEYQNVNQIDTNKSSLFSASGPNHRRKENVYVSDDVFGENTIENDKGSEHTYENEKKSKENTYENEKKSKENTYENEKNNMESTYGNEKKKMENIYSTIADDDYNV